MSALIPYVFEDAQIRVELSDNGEPWFVADDVCKALGFGNAHDAVSRHVDADDLGKREVIDSLGRKQKANFLNESGLYALIMGSRLESAKKFKRWVTSEVLPSIRKTGSYTAPVAAPVSKNEIAYRAAREALLSAGVHVGIAAATTLAIIEADTGVSMDHARKALPAVTEDLGGMTPTQLAERLGTNAARVNQRIGAAGLQVKNGKNWELTEFGKQHADAFPYARNGHTGTQIKWRETVLDVLRASEAV